MRISVTDLDQYRYWMEMEDVGPGWLIERLTTVEPSPAMAAGSAFHKMLETFDANIGTGICDRHVFHFGCECEIVNTSIREVKIECEVLPEVVLVGKMDAINGNCIVDYKLTARLDAERYADSMQWRAYLLLAGLPTFEYSVFEGFPRRKNELEYDITAHHRLKFYAYDGMERDVMECVQALATFITVHQVTAKLKRM